jgi:hypothetical protein
VESVVVAARYARTHVRVLYASRSPPESAALLDRVREAGRAEAQKQLPDGTVIWTLPDGHTYVTIPGSGLLFPSLCAPTGDPPVLETAPTTQRRGDRMAMMPLRTRTRAQNPPGCRGAIATSRSTGEEAIRLNYRTRHQAEDAAVLWCDVVGKPNDCQVLTSGLGCLSIADSSDGKTSAARARPPGRRLTRQPWTARGPGRRSASTTATTADGAAY